MKEFISIGFDENGKMVLRNLEITNTKKEPSIADKIKIHLKKLS